MECCLPPKHLCCFSSFASCDIKYSSAAMAEGQKVSGGLAAKLGLLQQNLAATRKLASVLSPPLSRPAPRPGQASLPTLAAPSCTGRTVPVGRRLPKGGQRAVSAAV